MIHVMQKHVWRRVVFLMPKNLMGITNLCCLSDKADKHHQWRKETWHTAKHAIDHHGSL